jgi:hypothetical protein
MGSGAPRVFNEGHGCEAPKGPHYAGAHLAGRNDKHRMPLAQKVPEHWTLRFFKSVLKGFSPYTRMKDSNLVHQNKANRLKSLRSLR